MKTRTHLHAGRAPTEREMLKCLEDKKALYQKIDALENSLNVPVFAETAAKPTYDAYPAPGENQGWFYPNWSGNCGCR